MANINTLIPLLLLSLLLNGIPAEAGHPKARKAMSAEAQIPFSFITPTKPSQTLSRLQATLQGRVVQEHELSPTQTVYTQVFLPSAQPTIRAIKPEPLASPKNQVLTTPIAAHTNQAQKGPFSQPDYPDRSWVSDLSTPQALPLAANIAEFLAGQYNAQTTTLLLAQTNRKQLNNPLTPELETQLRQAGFTLAKTRAESPQAQLVRYQVSTLGSGILVQLQTPTQWVSRYYPFTPTQALMATYPFSIRTLGDSNQ